MEDEATTKQKKIDKLKITDGAKKKDEDGETKDEDGEISSSSDLHILKVIRIRQLKTITPMIGLTLHLISKLHQKQ